MEVIPTSQLDFEEVYYQKEPAEVKKITENPDTEIFLEISLAPDLEIKGLR